MKNYIPSFDEFINESVKQENIILTGIDDANHTRIIKWLGNYFNSNQYDMKKVGKDEFVIDTKKMNKTGYEDLLNYLKSQNYIKESINEGVKVGDFVRYKRDNDFTGGKIVNISGAIATIKNWDGSESDFKLNDLEYVKSWNESVNEGAVKQFEMDFADMVKDIKSGYGWIDPEYVSDTWNNSSDSIDFELVKDEIYNRLIKAGLLYSPDPSDPEEKGKKITNINQIK